MPRCFLVVLLLAGACARKDKPVPADEPPIACVLDALTPEQRAREGVLLEEHLAGIREARELPDGYAFRYDPDPAHFARMAELVTLEHRCCPFLDFQLVWEGASDSPWLRITGSARGKAFLAETFAAR